MGLRRVAVHFRNGRRGERGRTSPGGGRPEKRRGGRGEHRSTVSQGRTSGRGTRRPGPRASRGRGQTVRSSRHGAYRAGEDQGYRRPGRDPHNLSGRQGRRRMRRVVASEFVSLDGVMEDPSWTFQFGSEEQEEFKFDELSASDAILLGRVTYEGFAAAWPRMMEQYEGPRQEKLAAYTDMMNGYPKHVISTTLEEAEWSNTTIIREDVVEEIKAL